MVLQCSIASRAKEAKKEEEKMVAVKTIPDDVSSKVFDLQESGLAPSNDFVSTPS